MFVFLELMIFFMTFGHFVILLFSSSLCVSFLVLRFTVFDWSFFIAFLHEILSVFFDSALTCSYLSNSRKFKKYTYGRLNVRCSVWINAEFIPIDAESGSLHNSSVLMQSPDQLRIHPS